jgi:endonuclease/exonuclease/phosphatase family metal-dependent hydrolase
MTELFVASYNVHRCIGRDGRHDVNRVARVIAGTGASIIGLQEVDLGREESDRADVQLLAEITGMTCIRGRIPSAHSRRWSNALLTTWPVLAQRRIDLSVARREPRGALDVDLRVGTTRLRILTTHFGLRPFERRIQTQQILAVTSVPTADMTVLLGDLNEWFIWGRPLRWLHAAFGASRAPRTFPSGTPLFALDRIWVKPRSALRRVSAFASARAAEASDHLPVIGELIL